MTYSSSFPCKITTLSTKKTKKQPIFFPPHATPLFHPPTTTFSPKTTHFFPKRLDIQKKIVSLLPIVSAIVLNNKLIDNNL